jgi:hypothetical protein
VETPLGWPVFAFAGLFAFLLLLTSNHPAYGYFVDELGYLACAKRLAFGYVDHPPLAPMVLAINRSLLGDSLPAMRLLPALCGAGTVLSAAWMAQRLGAARFAQLLAALCVSVAPVYLGVFSIFSTNCFEVLLWSLTLAALIELSRSGDTRLWWRVGLLLGLSVSSKHTSVALVAAIVLALPLSPLRRHLLDRQLWFGAALALIVVLPNLAWQIEHDWASLEFYRNVDREANVSTSVLEVLDEQVGSFNPATFPVWASGLFFLLFAARGRAYRLVGWVAAILFVALLLGGKSRPDRIMGIYPVLFAAVRCSSSRGSHDRGCAGCVMPCRPVWRRSAYSWRRC